MSRHLSLFCTVKSAQTRRYIFRFIAQSNRFLLIIKTNIVTNPFAFDNNSALYFTPYFADDAISSFLIPRVCFTFMSRTPGYLVLAQDVVANFSLRRDLITCTAALASSLSQIEPDFSTNRYHSTQHNVLGLSSRVTWHSYCDVITLSCGLTIKYPGVPAVSPGSFYKFPKTFLLTDCWRFENTPSIRGNVAPPCSTTTKCKNVLIKTNAYPAPTLCNTRQYKIFVWPQSGWGT